MQASYVDKIGQEGWESQPRTFLYLFTCAKALNKTYNEHQQRKQND